MALSEELECTGNVARDNHRGGETCDGQCRCEYCWDYAPTDAEVIADLRAKLKVRDVQLEQQNEQCQILLAKLAEVRRERDAARGAFTFPEHKCELRLTHNTHTVSYQTVSQLIAQQFEHYSDEYWVSPEQKAKAIETNELWTLHWYPSTPIGFYVLHAADLDELLRRAIEV